MTLLQERRGENIDLTLKAAMKTHALVSMIKKTDTVAVMTQEIANDTVKASEATVVTVGTIEVVSIINAAIDTVHLLIV